MANSVDDLRKLSPEERIRRLRELEAERRKEIESAEGLIKETVRELEEAEEKKSIPIPEARATDLDVLQTVEEKQIVATHHFLNTGTQTSSSPQSQKKSLEEVAAEEKAVTQSGQRQGGPVYGIGPSQHGVADYAASSRQTVTGQAAGAASPIEDKVTEFYREKATAEMEKSETHDKYLGQHQQVTGGYEMRKREEEDRKEFYKRKGGPA